MRNTGKRLRNSGDIVETHLKNTGETREKHWRNIGNTMVKIQRKNPENSRENTSENNSRNGRKTLSKHMKHSREISQKTIETQDKHKSNVVVTH